MCSLRGIKVSRTRPMAKQGMATVQELAVTTLGRFALRRAMLSERRARTMLGYLEFAPNVLYDGTPARGAAAGVWGTEDGSGEAPKGSGD